MLDELIGRQASGKDFDVSGEEISSSGVVAAHNSSASRHIEVGVEL